MVDDERATRVARNEALFRDVNERVKEVGERLEAVPPDGIWEFLCECGDQRCLERIRVTIDEYEHARSSPLFFFLVPGHEDIEVERVIDRTERFVLVEKTRAQDVARRASRR